MVARRTVRRLRGALCRAAAALRALRHRPGAGRAGLRRLPARAAAFRTHGLRGRLRISLGPSDRATSSSTAGSSSPGRWPALLAHRGARGRVALAAARAAGAAGGRAAARARLQPGLGAGAPLAAALGLAADAELLAATDRHRAPGRARPRAARDATCAARSRSTRAGARALQGAPVALVDDVMTTGATAREAAAALLRAGAAAVDVWVAGAHAAPGR